MGLCKCERKKVTNLFCFEHRVNVCEFCLVSSHDKCVVKSYLHWLKDSDYSSVCALCTKPLDDKEQDVCVRLMCLDIFHWRCLDSYALNLPPTTAPAGYDCPTCSQSIIPLENQGGPVAETLRTRLASARWLKSNFKGSAHQSKPKVKTAQRYEDAFNDFGASKLLDTTLDTYANKFLRDHEMVSPPQPDHSKNAEFIVPIEKIYTSPQTDHQIKVPSMNLSNPRNFIVDDDESDKYKRRLPQPKINQSLSVARWFSSIGRLTFRRNRILCVFGVILFLFFTSLLMLNAIGGPELTSNDLLMAAQVRAVPAAAET